MTALLTIALDTASLPVLKAALKEANAYAGTSRLGVADLRGYAKLAAAVRAAGIDEEITTANVGALVEKADELSKAKAAPVYTPAVAPTSVPRPVNKATGSKYARVTKAQRAELVKQIGAEDCWINEQDRFVGFFKGADGRFDARDLDSGVIVAGNLAREKARSVCRGIGREPAAK